MRDYAKVSPRFWTGDTGKQIRKLGRDAQVVAFYLVTCPSANMLGLYYLSLPTLCHETGIPLEPPSEGVGSPFGGAREALRSLENIGFAYYDEKTEHVYVPNMAREQIGELLTEKDNRRVSVRKELETLRKTPFFAPFVERYGEAYGLTDLAPSKPLRSPFGPPSKGVNEHQEPPSKPGAGAGAGTRAGTEAGTQSAPASETNRNGSSHKADFELTDRQHHERFLEFQAACPKRAGRTDWITAEQHYRNRIDEQDATHEELLDAAKRWAKYSDAVGDTGQKWCMSPVTFLSGRDRPWQQDWAIPEQPAKKPNGNGAKTHEQLMAELDAATDFSKPEFPDDEGRRQ